MARLLKPQKRVQNRATERARNIANMGQENCEVDFEPVDTKTKFNRINRLSDRAPMMSILLSCLKNYIEEDFAAHQAWGLRLSLKQEPCFTSKQLIPRATYFGLNGMQNEEAIC